MVGHVTGGITSRLGTAGEIKLPRGSESFVLRCVFGSPRSCNPFGKQAAKARQLVTQQNWRSAGRLLEVEVAQSQTRALHRSQEAVQGLSGRAGARGLLPRLSSSSQPRKPVCQAGTKHSRLCGGHRQMIHSNESDRENLIQALELVWREQNDLVDRFQLQFEKDRIELDPYGNWVVPVAIGAEEFDGAEALRAIDDVQGLTASRFGHGVDLVLDSGSETD